MHTQHRSVRETSGLATSFTWLATDQVDAVFGHATVGNFTEAIEVLSDSVMIFVNQVAEIVHGIVDESALHER